MPSDDTRDEAGFTIVEVLIAMMIGLLIAFAALTAFDAFDKGTASNSRLTDAEDNGRRDVANMVRILRDAGAPAPVTGAIPPTVTRAGVNDLVFKSTSWPNESATGITGTHTERLCLDTATKTDLVRRSARGYRGSDRSGPGLPEHGGGLDAPPDLSQGDEHRRASRLPARGQPRALGRHPAAHRQPGRRSARRTST